MASVSPAKDIRKDTLEFPLNQGNQNQPLAIKSEGLIKRLADAVLRTVHIARDAGGGCFAYENGVYTTSGELVVRRLVKVLLLEWGLSRKWSSHLAAEVVRYILVDAPELWDRPPLDILNVQNGLLNVLTAELRPHSPDFLSTIQIPVAYDPAASCPHWEKFISTTFPDDAYALAWQIVAWLMLPEISIQKSILALGEGSNGKSTWLTALTAFIGRSNISNISLHALEDDKFAAVGLVGKLANICPDLPSAHLTDTGAFKKVTGGDRVRVQQKYGLGFDVSLYARLVFSANQPPRSGDSTFAFFRRWLVIPFNRTFEGGEVVSRQVLDARLADSKELSGVLNKALDALPALRSYGFTESPSMKDAWNELRQTTDPLAVWLDNVVVEDPDGFVTKRVLCKAYNEYGKEAGRSNMSENAFGRALRRHRPNISDGQRKVGDEIHWAWLGITLPVGYRAWQ